MRLRLRAENALREVTSSAEKLGESAELAGIALAVVALVSLVALGVALVALERRS